MAVITRRESGRWQARIRKPGLSSSRTFRTRTNAEAWARKVESAMERGVWRDSDEADRLTLRDALLRYQGEVTPHKRGAIQEQSVIAVIIDHPISRLSLSRITGEVVAALRDDWVGDGFAPATIHNRMALLSHLFGIAVKEWGLLLPTNPVRLVSLPQVKNARARRVSDDEIVAICRSSESPPLPAIVRLAVETAMRRAELCGLRWEHIDLASQVAHIPRTKNGDARDVPLSSTAVRILRALPRQINGRVFTIAPGSASQAFARAVRRAGLTDIHFHDLRHEATSRFFELGRFGVMEVAAITGHKTLGMLKRYTHLRATELAKKLG